MTESLIVSNAVLWLIVLILAGVVVALTRQVGILHERVAPAGALALDRGPEVGEPAPQLVVGDLAGVPVALGGRETLGRRTLLFFLSPTCPVCKTLLPTLKKVATSEGPGLRVVYASDGNLEEHQRFAANNGLADTEYVLSTDLGLRFAVAKLPYAVLLDADGRVRAKGIVNTREHLESLFEADRLGVASVQAYLAGQAAPADEHSPLDQVTLYEEGVSS